MLQETYTTTLVFQPTLYWHKRNPPSYFLKRDGGFAYVIIKPKKTKASINPLGVDIYIYRYMISFGFSKRRGKSRFRNHGGSQLSETLKQIEEKGYAREYATDNRTIYQIGCNFSSKTGTIDDWKSKASSNSLI
jgi:hypothetical protein